MKRKARQPSLLYTMFLTATLHFLHSFFLSLFFLCFEKGERGLKGLLSFSLHCFIFIVFCLFLFLMFLGIEKDAKLISICLFPLADLLISFLFAVILITVL